MIIRNTRLRALASAGSLALLCASLSPTAAYALTTQAAVASYNIPAAPLAQSLLELGRQAGISIAAPQQVTAGLRGNAVTGQLSTEEALSRLLAGTGLRAEFTSSTSVRIISNSGAGNNGPQYANDDATSVADIIVTAQKREQSIQDVPIAVSAFSAENLDAMKIEGGSELLRAIPNVAFSKSNFSMYNFSIRGIGTKAISAASDPAVAISFNNAPMIRNRLFESEYLDVSRVEVLRGPQGTLYGRNATAGVVNMIPNLPRPDFDATAKVEAGNYGSRRGQAMLNLPVTDTFWLRGAASMTQRDGFDYNTYNDTHVNGRDLYSVRLGALWEPNDRFSANLIWERFAEDDDRSRTGKQLCTRDPGPSKVGNSEILLPGIQGKLSQGCLPGSLYSDLAYQTPNASGLATLQILGSIFEIGHTGIIWEGGEVVNSVKMGIDPFAGRTQSKNLREIEAHFNPKYEAKNDVIQFNINHSINDNLEFISQTLYTTDRFKSSQDYSRYGSNDIFNDSNGLYYGFTGDPIVGSEISPGGIYTDPQLGASKGMLSLDLSRSKNSQFYQEFRIQSNGYDRVNFNAGVNYIKFETEDNYFVFNNTFSIMAEYFYGLDGSQLPALISARCDGPTTSIECVYVDYTDLDNLAGDGHNYFRSLNVVNTESSAAFGEIYAKLNDKTNVTLGLRYTSDKKITTPYPSQLLLGYSDTIKSPNTGGYISRGFVAQPDIKQKWDAVTGRAVFDWSPSEDTMIYASYSRGYKGGGANPPRADINPLIVQYQPLPELFKPEYVNAFEIGAKTVLLDGTLKLNGTAFYYDYKDYQVSQIVDRISLNENFDSTSMGLELEAVWRPTRQFRMDVNLGYLKTKIGDGESSIDVMNRTQGNPDWMVIRPWAQVPSNCIAPTEHVEKLISPEFSDFWLLSLSALCGGAYRVGSFDPAFQANFPLWFFTGIHYNPLTDAPNGGRGFSADLSGNELPNAPRWTANVGAQYTWFIGNSELTLRGDYYRQADSYFRVYNTEYDQIRGWDNLNLAVTWDMPQSNTTIQAYVKNVLDDAPIVDAFTNSDDSMLTTNVFTLDPRVWGVSLTKRF